MVRPLVTLLALCCGFGVLVSSANSATPTGSPAVIFDTLLQGNVCQTSATAISCSGLNVGRNFLSERFFNAAPSNTAVASSFTIPGNQNYYLDKIELPIQYVGGGVQPSNYNITIKNADANGLPGDAFQTLFFAYRPGNLIPSSASGSQPAPIVESNISNTSPVLLFGGVKYWLTLSIASPLASLNSELTWNFNLTQPSPDTTTATKVLDPFTGAIDGTVGWTAGIGGQPALRITGIPYAPPQPSLSIAPPSITFSDQKVTTCAAATQSVTLSNLGSTALGIGQISIIGTNQADFAIAGNSCNNTTLSAGNTANSTCTITVAFCPSDIGPRTAVLTIPRGVSTANDAVALSGTGIPNVPRLFGIAVGQNDNINIRGDKNAIDVFAILKEKTAWSTVGNPEGPVIINGNPSMTLTAQGWSTSWADSSQLQPAGEAAVIISDLKNRLQNIEKYIQEGDTFVFYANVHGLQDFGGNYGAAERPDANGSVSDEKFAFLLTDDEFTSWFNTPKWNQARKIFILDICHAGGFVGGGDEGDLDRLPKSMVIAAAEEEKLANAFTIGWFSPYDPYLGLLPDLGGRGVFTVAAVLPALSQNALTGSTLVSKTYAASQTNNSAIYPLIGLSLPTFGLPGESSIFSPSQPAIYISSDFDLNASLPVEITSIPFAVPGADQQLEIGTVALLDGSGSTDPTNAYPLTYQWTLETKPTSSALAISSSDKPSISLIPDLAGVYLVKLVVTNANGVASAPRFVTISVGPALIANAGTDRTIEATSAMGSSVQLDGSGSSHPNGLPLIYSWRGSFGTVVGSTPVVPLQLGKNRVDLSVSDGGGGNGSSSVTITVVDTTPPTVTCPTNISQQFGNPLILGTATATDLVTASPTITSNASGTFPVGKTTVTWTAKDAAGNSSSCAQTVTLTQILTFPYKGFLGSAKNPPMVNVIGPSDVIALKFNLGGDRGLGVIAAGYPSSSKIACANGPLNKAEDIDTSKRGLYYDTKTSTYRYVWQADKSSKGTCQLFTLKLVDGTEHQLLFKITK